jgi:hypothetical protein
MSTAGIIFIEALIGLIFVKADINKFYREPRIILVDELSPDWVDKLDLFKLA